MADPLTLGLGAVSLLGGLFGQRSSGLNEDFFKIANSDYAYNRSKEFADPNSQLYSKASRGFYNRLTNALPSTSSLLQQLASQGINSPTVANMQRRASELRAGTQASDYESDLFGNMQNLGLGYLQQYFQNQRFQKEAYANQRNRDVDRSNEGYGSLANFGGGILGYQLGQSGNNTSETNSMRNIPGGYGRAGANVGRLVSGYWYL